MSWTPGTPRFLLPRLALLPLLALPGCQSIATDVSVSPKSSLLAVDVRFPAPLSRDPFLVQVFFVRGPIHGGLEHLPELIPASFVKWDRAYLIDPVPGTYSVVAVSSALAPPWNDAPVFGVTKTRWSGISADAMIFPAGLIQRTRTTIAPGSVAFMGALQIKKGERIDANAVFQDYLQKRLTERIRPDATSESGLSRLLTRTFMVNLEKTSFSNDAEDRDSFQTDALADLAESPWTQVVARAAPPQIAVASEQPRTRQSKSTPASRAEVVAIAQTAASGPEAVVATHQSAASDPEPLIPEPHSPDLTAAARPPETTPPIPERRRFAGLPPGSPLAAIEFGMRHDEVREILGPPDDSINRYTAKAWIPFYTGSGGYLRDWIYAGKGRVVFSLHRGSLDVLDVVYNPDEH